MHARTAEPGDGKWTLLADDGTPVAHAPGADRGAPVMAMTTLHPHALKKWLFVTFVAFDMSLVDLSLVAGTDEPETDVVPEERRTGLVPREDYDRMLVAFNGGFMTRHGRWGVRIAKDQFVEPRKEGCVVARTTLGALVVGPWLELEPRLADLDYYRQTPPCLIERGRRSPLLEREHVKRWWGTAEGGTLDIRRSALALDASGRAFIYAFGDWITAAELTSALEAIGSTAAAQLDINWSYTRFFFFEHPPGQRPRIRDTIIPKLEFARERYVTKPSPRDFFYVSKKPSARR